MLLAQFLQKLVGGSSTSGLHILICFARAMHGFAVVLPLPFQIVREHLIQRRNGVFPVALCVIVQLGLTFRRETYFHATKVGVLLFCVNRGGAVTEKRASGMIAVDPA
jgi:hypothetical protein